MFAIFLTYQLLTKKLFLLLIVTKITFYAINLAKIIIVLYASFHFFTTEIFKTEITA